MYCISSFFIPALLASSALASPLSKRVTNHNNTANPIGENVALIAKLESAPTAVDRLALLTDSADFLFDFQAAAAGSTTMGQGGKTVKADRKQFPALIGTGVSMTLGFLGPCGFNTPHVHPRSSEINVVVQGALVAEFVAENGAQPIVNNLTQYQMTVFPQGAMHTEFNPLCTESIFVAGFASEDPGVQQTAQSFFGLESDIVKAALGGDGTVDGMDIDAFRSLVPHNVALGVDSCLQVCGIQKRATDGPKKGPTRYAAEAFGK